MPKWFTKTWGEPDISGQPMDRPRFGDSENRWFKWRRDMRRIQRLRERNK